MSEVLRRLGCDVTYERTGDGGGGGRVVVDVPGEALDRDRLRPGPPDARLDQRARPAGRPLRLGRVAAPGGDAIGSRGLDMHISGLERLGATIVSEHGFLVATAPRLHRHLDLAGLPQRRRDREPGDGGRPGQGTTVIDNAAREPEIVDLCAMLNAMGARIEGAGTSTITVEGVEPCRRCHTTVRRPDRRRHLGVRRRR